MIPCRFGTAQWVYLVILGVTFAAMLYFPIVPANCAAASAACPRCPPGGGSGAGGAPPTLVAEAGLPLSRSPRRARELLRDATLEALNLVAAATDNRMGHTGNEREQTLQLWSLVDANVPSAGTFCEVGVNVGHSAAIMLSASSATSFLAFDCGGKPSVYEGFKLLQRVFSYASFEFVEGNSAFTMYKYAQDHPKTTCDLIHIDGAHDGPFPASDFAAMHHFAREDGKTFVVFDDCNCATEWCIAPLAVFKKAVADGIIEELPGGASYLDIPGGQKGSCLGWLKSRDAQPVAAVPSQLLDQRNGNLLPVTQKCSF
jgi:hypothetical protein